MWPRRPTTAFAARRWAPPVSDESGQFEILAAELRPWARQAERHEVGRQRLARGLELAVSIVFVGVTALSAWLFWLPTLPRMLR